MIQTKVLTIKKETIFILTQFGLLMSVAVFAPLFHNQAITGPIVNAVLFISVFMTGVRGAVLIALIPSLIALSVGFLSLLLAPIVPFIMMSNIILVLSFAFLKQKNFWLAVILSSIFKFAFLFWVSSMVINLIIKKEIAVRAAVMMGWSQLITALAGGIIAYFLLKAIKKI